jgi:hypothetical protein
LLGKNDLGIQSLDSAFKYRFVDKRLFLGDPAFQVIKDYPAMKNLQAKIDARLAFNKHALENALARAEASQQLKAMTDR